MSKFLVSQYCHCANCYNMIVFCQSIKVNFTFYKTDVKYDKIYTKVWVHNNEVTELYPSRPNITGINCFSIHNLPYLVNIFHDKCNLKPN